MEKSKDNLVIIDADSLIYIIGYELSAMQLEPLGALKLDEFIKDILVATGSKHYMGYFGGACGRNFRHDIAVTREYKGNRSKEKEDWFEFWQPILKERMESYWKFEPVCNMEADDAVAIAANEYRNRYNKVTIASPDKDLLQIPDMWFYDYNKRTTVFCDETVSMHKLCGQLITGDSSDNIPGCMGAGPAKAEKFLLEAVTDNYSNGDLLDKVKDYYIEWHTVILRDKAMAKQQKDYLANYKVENGLTRFTAKIKDQALQSFTFDSSVLMNKIDVKQFFKEQHRLIKLVDTIEEGKKYDFELTNPIIDTTVDWSSILIFHEELDAIPDEEDFDFQDDL